MAKLGNLLVSIVIMALGAGLLSCDEVFYHPDEIRAEKRFQSITIGSTEEDLKKQLGEPNGRIVFDQARETYRYLTVSNPTTATEFRTLDAIRNSNPSELRFLPVSKKGHKILVFIDGTVHGYFYFGEAGQLEDKVVVVS